MLRLTIGRPQESLAAHGAGTPGIRIRLPLHHKFPLSLNSFFLVPGFILPQPCMLTAQSSLIPWARDYWLSSTDHLSLPPSDNRDAISHPPLQLVLARA